MEKANKQGSASTEGQLSAILSAVEGFNEVDIIQALSRIGGKQDVLEAAIEQTAFSMDEKLNRMRTLIKSEDLQDFSIEAHGLKNAFAGIGASKLSLHAAELEKESKDGNGLFCEVSFNHFAASAESLAARLRTVYQPRETENRREGDNEQFTRAAEQAARSLIAFEADDALKCLGELRPFTFGEDADALLEHIINKIKSYKYDEAILLLKSFVR